MLVLANKRDAPGAMSVEAIKEAFNKHVVRPRRLIVLTPQVRYNVSEGAVLPISALKAEGIREAVQWLFLRVWSARQPRPPTQPLR